jgi:3-oxoacyl-[acyl-carrier-protein] synthase-3
MLFLHGIGHAHPENELDNRFLEELEIGTSHDWIVERTGIHSRRTVLPLDYIRTTRNADPRAAEEAAVCSNTSLATQAAEMALARAGIGRGEIGLVISGGSLPGYASPAEACLIAATLDLDVPAYDLRSACTSFGLAMHTLAMMREDALPPFVLVAMAETLTRGVDYRDRNAAVLWGDGAAAAVFSTRHLGPAWIQLTSFASRPSGWESVVVPYGGHFAQTGATVQSFAIKRTSQVLRTIQKQLGGSGEESGRNRRLHFIGHQANLLMLESVCRRCEIAPERHHSNVTRFGNTATAGSPAVLSQNWQLFGEGDDVAIVGVGSGLSWSGATIRFGI